MLEEVGAILLADPGRSTFFRLADHCQRRFGAQMLELKAARRASPGAYLLVIKGSAR